MTDITYSQLFNRDVIPLGYYDILENDDKQIAFVMETELAEPPTDPVFYYDGGPHGIMAGQSGPVFICDYIHTGIRENLEKQEKVFFFSLLPKEHPLRDSTKPLEFWAPLHWQVDTRDLANQLVDLGKDLDSDETPPFDLYPK